MNGLHGADHRRRRRPLLLLHHNAGDRLRRRLICSRLHRRLHLLELHETQGREQNRHTPNIRNILFAMTSPLDQKQKNQIATRLHFYSNPLLLVGNICTRKPPAPYLRKYNVGLNFAAAAKSLLKLDSTRTRRDSRDSADVTIFSLSLRLT